MRTASMGKPNRSAIFKINPCVIEFGEAEAGGRKHAIDARRSHGTRWTATLPGALCYLEELMPIASYPTSLAPFRYGELDRSTIRCALALWVACYFLRATACFIYDRSAARPHRVSTHCFKHVTMRRVAGDRSRHEYAAIVLTSQLVA